jgi:hypothetical protein
MKFGCLRFRLNSVALQQRVRATPSTAVHHMTNVISARDLYALDRRQILKLSSEGLIRSAQAVREVWSSRHPRDMSRWGALAALAGS